MCEELFPVCAIAAAFFVCAGDRPGTGWPLPQPPQLLSPLLLLPPPLQWPFKKIIFFYFLGGRDRSTTTPAAVTTIAVTFFIFFGRDRLGATSRLPGGWTHSTGSRLPVPALYQPGTSCCLLLAVLFSHLQLTLTVSRNAVTLVYNCLTFSLEITYMLFQYAMEEFRFRKKN